MATQSPESGTENQSYAGVPPPVIFFGALVIGLVLNLQWPLAIFAEAKVGDVLGLIAAFAGVTLALWAIRTMQRAGEQPDPRVPTQSIVQQGPFARMRNPIYLAFALFNLGVALVLNNLWVAIVIAALMVYVDLIIVRREERALERQFGDAYRDYKQSVRRWL